MEFENERYKNKSIETDGNRYVRCHFFECTLEYSGGTPPAFMHCVLEQSKFAFTEQAANTLAFLKSMYHGGFKPVVEDTFEDIKGVPTYNRIRV